jgi:hypothetical protein
VRNLTDRVQRVGLAVYSRGPGPEQLLRDAVYLDVPPDGRLYDLEASTPACQWGAVLAAVDSFAWDHANVNRDAYIGGATGLTGVPCRRVRRPH